MKIQRKQCNATIIQLCKIIDLRFRFTRQNYHCQLDFKFIDIRTNSHSSRQSSNMHSRKLKWQSHFLISVNSSAVNSWLRKSIDLLTSKQNISDQLINGSDLIYANSQMHCNHEHNWNWKERGRNVWIRN